MEQIHHRGVPASPETSHELLDYSEEVGRRGKIVRVASRVSYFSLKAKVPSLNKRESRCFIFLKIPCTPTKQEILA